MPIVLLLHCITLLYYSILLSPHADADSQTRGLEAARMLQVRTQSQPVPAGGRGGAGPQAAGAAVTAGSGAQALWRSDALDRLAAALAEPGLLAGQPAAAPLLGALLAGAGPLPLLREDAALAALTGLQRLLEAPADQPGRHPFIF